MRKHNGSRTVLVLALLVFLLVSPPLKAKAGSPIDGNLTISETLNREEAPAVAYNPQRQEYLVVWYNDRPGCDDIQAQRVAKNGGLVGNSFFVAAGCPVERRYPDVAYNSADNEYLVVWEQYDASNGFAIRARRVSAQGAVLDSSDLAVRGYGLNLYTPLRPAVAYATTAERYMVVWSETWHPMPITYSIQGQALLRTGANDGGPFPVSEGADLRERPDLAYNRHANRYMVVWQQKAGSMYDIHGQQVHGGGGKYQGDIVIAMLTMSSNAPRVAALPNSPTANPFLVVCELEYAPGDHDIFGILMQEDGTLGPGFFIGWTPGIEDTAPAVAASEGGQNFMVTWRASLGVMSKPIYSRVVSPNGDLSSVDEYSGVAADTPAVAAGPTGDYLTVWRDQPLAITHPNLYGRLWGNRVFIPLVEK